MKEKSIYIISATYPFGKGEEFVKKELKELSKHFEAIYLFPLNGSGEQRWLPNNVSLNLALTKTSRSVPSRLYFENLILILKALWIEFFKAGRKGYILSTLRTQINSLLQAKILSVVFESERMDKLAPCYSVWMDDGALMLSILHVEKKVKKFTFRLHGYDLFDERRSGNYMPFRCFNFKHAAKIFVLSKAGLDYLTKKNIYPEKLIVNYSGVYDNGDNSLNSNSEFTIVSCSNVIPIKRLDKIISTISLLDFKVKWIHFGDGENMMEIRALASSLPSNVSYELPGYVNNEKIIEFYKNTPVNIFLHLSDTEGLGMAIVEAQSFGIPAVAVNVGGVAEVVNEQTGILVSKEDAPEKIAQKIRILRLGEMNTESYRKGVKTLWKQKFSSVENYQYFYEKLME